MKTDDRHVLVVSALARGCNPSLLAPAQVFNDWLDRMLNNSPIPGLLVYPEGECGVAKYPLGAACERALFLAMLCAMPCALA